MIAKIDWFSRRKYTGWGLTPKTWQGFLYVIVAVVVLSAVQALPINKTASMVLTGILTFLFVVDILQAMAAIKLDEMEQKIEAIAERNASWSMVAASILSVFYVTTLGSGLRGTDLIPLLIFPVIVGLAAKAITNYILGSRGI